MKALQKEQSRQLQLRSVNLSALQMRRAVIGWIGNYKLNTVSYKSINNKKAINDDASWDQGQQLERRYIAFTANGIYGLWDGLIEAKEWFACFSPALASLAASYYDENQVVELFQTTKLPFSLKLPNLNYEELEVKAVVSEKHLPNYPLACIATSQSPVWLQTLPRNALSWPEPQIKHLTESLPVSVVFELGYSTISLGLLQKIAVADVLLLGIVTMHIKICGEILGSYSLALEKNLVKGVKVENFNGENKSDNNDDDNINDLNEDDEDDEDHHDNDDEDSELFDEDDENLGELNVSADDEQNIIKEKNIEAEEDLSKAIATHNVSSATSEINDISDIKESTDLDSVNHAKLGGLGKIPVRVEFILAERTMRVAELNELHHGYVMQLSKNVEENIILRVNGAVIATGELVQLKDKLGVEIKSLSKPLQ